jgi:hypothetical protein
MSETPFNPVLTNRNKLTTTTKFTPTALTSEIEHTTFQEDHWLNKAVLCGSADALIQEQFNEHMRKSIQ